MPRSVSLLASTDGTSDEQKTVVLVFNCSLADENLLHVNKELSSETVWSKTIDPFEEMPYTSSQLLADFVCDFNLYRGDFCESIGVLARFRVVCPKTHRLCKVENSIESDGHSRDD